MNFDIKKFSSLNSTNIKAKELVAAGAGPWTVVVAKKQESGYGRKKDAWFSPEGGLYFSVILPKSNIEDLQLMTIFAAFCVARSIKENFGVEPFVKLPNDVYLNGRKVCGVLTENIILGQVKSSVIGIGINTNIKAFPAEFATATSLEIELGKPIDNNLILEHSITQLQSMFKAISR